MVAVGNLDKIWLSVPENPGANEMQDAFQVYFGSKWTDVLDAADTSFLYNSANNAYFAVRDLRLIKNLTLEQLLGENRLDRHINLIIS